MSEHWSIEEDRAIVDEYVEMLKLELSGQPYNKSSRNAAVRERLNARSKGSVEFKHQNISAAMQTLGMPYVDGYKPRGNLQALLADTVSNRLAADAELRQLLLANVDASPTLDRVPVGSFAQVLVEPPVRGAGISVPQGPSTEQRVVVGVNWLEREARNIALGLEGEKFVVELERERLWSRGAKSLSDEVEHVSLTRGDGLGYDVRSFESDGRERHIEVKTTRFGQMTPFFATVNEVESSERLAPSYSVYRVFRFDASPRLFVLRGSMRSSLNLETALYRASF